MLRIRCCFVQELKDVENRLIAKEAAAPTEQRKRKSQTKKKNIENHFTNLKNTDLQ